MRRLIDGPKVHLFGGGGQRSITTLMKILLQQCYTCELPCPVVFQVPGYYFDALNGNTRLGKAVRSACDELEILNHQVWGLVGHQGDRAFKPKADCTE